MPLELICASVRYKQTRFTQSVIKSNKEWVLVYMLCLRTLPPALFNSKCKGIERHVPRMQMSKQFLTLTTNFLLLTLLSRSMVKHTGKNYCSRCILQRSKPCRKLVKSQLLLAAILRQKPRICGKTEGSWSLLSRAEAQVHLYVSAMQSFLFLQPVTCNREEDSFSSSL